MKKSTVKLVTPMYFVYRNGRKMTAKAFKAGFPTYEAARNETRKFLRANNGTRIFSNVFFDITIKKVVA